MTPCEKNSQITKQTNTLQMNSQQKYNSTYTGSSIYLQQTGATGQIYKLIIKVDKVRARPGPKCKKSKLMTITTNNYKQLNQCNEFQKKISNESSKKDEVINVDSPPIVNLRENDIITIQDDSSNKSNVQCSICQQIFHSSQSLLLHKKKHFVCQFCDKLCESKVLCDNHEKIHLNEDSMLPLKCHLCSKTFDNKRNIKIRSKISHSEVKSNVEGEQASTLHDCSNSKTSTENQTEFQCEICKVILRNDDLYECHVSHAAENEVKNGDDKPHEINSESNHDANTKYSCKVCCKEFDSPKEAEVHTYVHVEIDGAEHKCNICKKLFKAEKMLNDHLAHHLSRAHHCVICRKAFINRTTLKIHMRTHKNTK